MRKISAIFLLLLFLFSTTGYYVFYSIQVYRAKKEAKMLVLAGLPDSMLETIEASVNIHWEEEEEFSLDGDMYDVVRVEIKDGKTLYHCINDKKEQELLNRLARAARSAHHPVKGKNSNPFTGFQLASPEEYPLPQPGWELYTGRKKQFAYNARLISSCKEILVPPPRA